MNLVDSCGWVEYFTDGPNSDWFRPAIEETENLLVPTLVIFEVFKRLIQTIDEETALEAVATMTEGRVVELDTPVALLAARLSLEHRLPLADSVILATAHLYGATVWTEDSHFEGLPSVKYVRKH